MMILSSRLSRPFYVVRVKPGNAPTGRRRLIGQVEQFVGLDEQPTSGLKMASILQYINSV
jgi:hypothetical protein